MQTESLDQSRFKTNNQIIIVNRFARGDAIFNCWFEQIESLLPVFQSQDSIVVIIRNQCISNQLVPNR